MEWWMLALFLTDQGPSNPGPGARYFLRQTSGPLRASDPVKVPKYPKKPRLHSHVKEEFQDLPPFYGQGIWIYSADSLSSWDHDQGSEWRVLYIEVFIHVGLDGCLAVAWKTITFNVWREFCSLYGNEQLVYFFLLSLNPQILSACTSFQAIMESSLLFFFLSVWNKFFSSVAV